jgi:DNA-binding TFAR19-related protein (PDSD5 family)
MSDATLTRIERGQGYEDDVDELLSAYRSLSADHAALKAAVVQALNRVGNLRVICPELAEAVEPKGADDARIP